MSWEWVDPRLDWHPGQPPGYTKILIREAVRADIPFLARQLKVKVGSLLKWVHSHGYSVWVATRNFRNPVGVVVCKHDPDRNTILRYWNAELYDRVDFPTRLLLLAALEKPEVPTYITVATDDDRTNAVVAALGWKLSDVRDDENEYRSEPWLPGPADAG